MDKNNEDDGMILFPQARENIKAKTKNSQLKFSNPDVVYNSMNMGPWDFTCTKCDTKTQFECKGMIFRVMDFYCSSCGTLHRVTNPAFASGYRIK